MRNTTSSICFAALLTLSFATAPGHAQQARSFVSASGSDTNAPNCTRNAPCRTFQAAQDSTLDNGEITVIDPGSYGAVTINRNISIINDGVGEAGILVSGGNTGVTINAPGTAAITLRGITIKGIGFGGGNGIKFNSGAALNIENCTIRNLNGSSVGNGLIFAPSTGTSGLQITNTVVSDNTADGIIILPAGPTNVNAVLDHVGLYSNGNTGLTVATQLVGGVVSATVIDSVASNNGGSGVGAGFLAQSQNPGGGGSALVSLFLNRSAAVTNPNNGVQASGVTGIANVLVNQSVISRNANGWVATGGSGRVFSYGNNSVDSNGANEGNQMALALK
jgi:hypothetical protein